jgi:hypothetical protein
VAQILRHFEFDLLQGHPQFPSAVHTGEQAALRHVLQGGHHEQGIAFRVPVHEGGQAGRRVAGRWLDRQILLHFRLAQRDQGDFATQAVDQQIRYESLQGMAGRFRMQRAAGRKQHQFRGGPAARQRRDEVHRGVIDPVQVFE